MLIGLFVIFAISVTTSFFLTILMKKVGVKSGALALPGETKIHIKSVPLLGGSAIFLSFVISLFLINHFVKSISGGVIGVVFGGTVIWILGILDDIRKLTAKFRLVIQLLPFGILLMFGIRIFGIQSLSLNYGIMLFWVLGITNGFNIIDGMDGLAAGLAIICSGFLALLAWNMGDALLVLILIALAGSCLGFLKFNFKPASIFMGDSGSTFLGFTLAGLSIVGQWSAKEINNLLISPTILGLIIFDMTLITILRIKNGQVSNFKEWIEYVGRDHFYDRLVNLGLSQKHTVLIAYLICACLGLISLLIQNASLVLLAFIVLFLITAGLLAIFKLDSAERRETKVNMRV